MHYLGLILFPTKPLRRDVEAVMRHWDDHFDWFRIGGRWSGYLKGKGEMRRRYKDIIGSGTGKDSLSANSGRLRDLRMHLTPAFLIVDAGG